MNQVQRAARHQQRVEQLCAAAVRALSGEPALHFRGGRLHHGEAPLALHAPHLAPSLEHDDFFSFRGAMDSIALRQRHSDAAAHLLHCPPDPVERLVFELLEQLRAESLAPAHMPGMRANLLRRFSAWSLAFHHSGATATSLGILVYTVAQMCWSRLSGHAVLDQTEDLIEATRAALAPVLGSDLAGLRRHRGAQDVFAPHALAIARLVGGMNRTAAGARDAARPRLRHSGAGGFSLFIDSGADADEAVAAPPAGPGHAPLPATAYRIFTTAYDREVPARTLVREPLLRELRARLDASVAAQPINLGRLARQCTALLALPRRDGWTDGEEEGRIDGRRLAQLVASPAERRLFRLERHVPATDCVVSFLIDCSGSMKEHIAQVAVLVDVLARALEQAGAATEILGFTTGAWNGGRARRDWLQQRQPGDPGRLNERCHMVFKQANISWRRARGAIAALLKQDLFREGIDGEAVEWAAARLRARAEQRRLLFVISDGSPTDTATGLANHGGYLEQHLRHVVTRIEREGIVEIFGIGVGLDLSKLYRHCLATDPSKPITQSLLNDIILLAKRRSRSVGNHA
jgi:cobaltochelatase CobT